MKKLLKWFNGIDLLILVLVIMFLCLMPLMAADIEIISPTLEGVWDFGGGITIDTIDDSGSSAIAISSHATVTGTLTATDVTSTDDITVGDDLVVTGLATIGETLVVDGASTLTGNALLSGTLNMGTASADGGVFSIIKGDTGSDPTFSITQAATEVTLDETVGDINITAADDITITSTGDVISIVSAAVDFNGTITVDTISDSGSNDIDISTNVAVAGNFAITGAVTASSTLGVTGMVSVTTPYAVRFSSMSATSYSTIPSVKGIMIVSDVGDVYVSTQTVTAVWLKIGP